MPDDLSSIAASSDAGGIAARKGFRIQDHVAARLALEMLHDPTILQLECETGDDVVLRRMEGGQTIIEYIQVKTTEIDAKWSIKELTARVGGRQGSSICEKSLLCDKHGETAWFRFVTTRAISTKLQPFRRPRAKRADYKGLEALVVSFSNKFKAVQSPSGRNLGDWASNMFWEIEGEEDALISRNINALLKLSGGQGVNPSYESMDAVYRELADKVRTMGDKPSADAEEKVWTRHDCLDWWASRVDAMRTAANASVKVYQISNVPQFFSEICSMDEDTIRRALYAYDVEFDGDVWRRDELIDHLLDWLPEIALPPQTLANFNHLAARRLPGEALRELDRRGSTDIPQLIAALMLHAILRHHFGAEPIACRIFVLIGGTMRASSAHIVQLPSGEEIWLGRSRLVTASSHEAVIDEVLAELRTGLTRDVLKEERDIIIQLREPRHLRDDKLDAILSKTGKTSELLKVMRLPLLVAYDSATLGSGFDAGYLDSLKEEVAMEYARIKALLGDELASVQISLFLVPVECADTLALDFEQKLRK
ncbi:hypothetical protein GGC65_002366 [Sphingopyxis sp. OAS728]|uniref:HamA C-terminal domain-containing protein n=1 Tax=Sphingopyxis sp. OAS728 TaxID=2663823 RepID=UPI00178B9C6B|nr:dsDNA nuclease domain-containing protein [Sphingopyxis sp. OAS728]MBE1527910.1 hypothetical protein [Sphingopyxis sp. OAS728]